MNNYIIYQYIKKIQKEDINKFALKQGIQLDNNELDIIYYYIKNEYKNFLNGNQKSILEDIKNKVKPTTYNKIESLYNQYKDYL